MSNKNCKYAENKIKRMKKKDYRRTGRVCQWYIIDNDSNLCFWEYIGNPSNQRPHGKEEISRLLGTTQYNIYTIHITALKKIRKALEKDPETAKIFKIPT